MSSAQLFSRGGHDWRYFRNKFQYPHLKNNLFLEVIDTWAYVYKVRLGLPLGFGLMVLWDLQGNSLFLSEFVFEFFDLNEN
jgi:hypothetical protein